MATADDLLRDGFGPEPKFRLRDCGLENNPHPSEAWQPAGFAVLFYNSSTFRGRPGLYLEDLYIRLVFGGAASGIELPC